MIGRGGVDDLPGGGPGYLQLIGSRRLSTELGDLVEAVGALGEVPHDLDHRERPRHQEHGDQGEPHRDLVRDELRGRAQASEQRVLVVRSPAPQDDPVDADRRDREEKQEPDVDVRRDPERGPDSPHAYRRPEGDDGEGRERRNHGEDRREEVHRLFRLRRRDVFLRHEFHEVGDALKDALRADPVGSEARLHEAHEPPLGEHDDEADDRGDDRDEDEDLEIRQDRGREEPHRSTSPNTMSIVPMSATRSLIRWPLASRGSA